MCGGFTCSKNTLLGLNIVYVLVSFLLIGVATYGKSAGAVLSLPVLGGIVASGVFLLFVAVFGLIATLKHHQIMLFFYMIILFGIFIIEFSVSCAALGFDERKEMLVIENTWKAAPETARLDAERFLGCCGFEDPVKEKVNASCQVIPVCKGDPVACPPCKPIIANNVDSAFNTSGVLGLLFSFTEIVGAILAYRFRNQADPYSPSASSTLFN